MLDKNEIEYLSAEVFQGLKKLQILWVFKRFSPPKYEMQNEHAMILFMAQIYINFGFNMLANARLFGHKIKQNWRCM